MDIPTPIENRLVDLEIKAGFTEDLLDQLNAQVYRQQQQIDALIQELRQMRDRLPESGGGAEVRNLRDAVPSIDVGLVWRRGSGLKPAATEFIELAREQARPRRT